MEEVKVYDASTVFYDREEMSLDELPPIPQSFIDAVTEAGGYCDGKPNVRIVSGLDPTIQEFYGGRFWRKYAFVENIETEYAIWHKPDGSKVTLSKEEGLKLSKNRTKEGILIPVKDTITKEFGVPRYFAELYKPPEMFGIQEAWDKERFIQEEDGKLLDLMGEFPSEGAYETWFCIEKPIIEEGVVVKTNYRELDDIVLEFVLAKIERAKEFTSQTKSHALLRGEIDQEYRDHKVELKEKIKEIVAEHADRLMQG